MKLKKQSFDASGLGGYVVVLTGGDSAERDISLQSGRAVFAALQALNVEARMVDISEGYIAELQQNKPAFAFIAVHGRGGEDGILQAVLDSLSIPYSGSNVLGSALAMDKVRSKCVWKGTDVPTAPFRYLSGAASLQSLDRELQEILAEMGGKVFVKPANEGSSFGMACAHDQRELVEAVRNARKFDDCILIEKFIDGPEYTVPLLEGVQLPTIRIETSREFYDFDAKYQDDDTQFHLPSGLLDREEKALTSIARRAFDALGCSGWGRVDVMREAASGDFQVLEVNTIPGLTDHSLVPKSAAAMGIGFPDLIGMIINVALIGRYEHAVL